MNLCSVFMNVEDDIFVINLMWIVFVVRYENSIVYFFDWVFFFLVFCVIMFKGLNIFNLLFVNGGLGFNLFFGKLDIF